MLLGYALRAIQIPPLDFLNIKNKSEDSCAARNKDNIKYRTWVEEEKMNIWW